MTKHFASKIFVVFVACLATLSFSKAIGEERIKYGRSIRPILSEKCFVCHGPDANRREGDLRLDVEADAKDYAIVEGRPAESEFFARIASHDADERMPPPDAGKQLTEEEVDVLRRWIEQGAPYEGHWSFVPPTRPGPPRVGDESWVRGAIDRFVFARLEAEGLKPSGEADRHTLIRRLSLDLTGLPPTIDEVDAFVQDKSDVAYEKVVDRLLQSDRFGEHMARYWLDAVRYADTNGYQYDLEREQWVWRDWVINAFNRNMPFDQFTTEQIAGDLLTGATDQQKLATAFHRNHPITIEGGVIDEEYRTEYVIDRVVTTSTVWLGLTMTCGRCHDHKYDPISQRDFYSFFAFFNNVPERGLNGFDPRIKVASPMRQGQLAAPESKITDVRRRFDQLVEAAGPQFENWEKQVSATQVDSWSVIVPEQMNSAGGATLTVQDDQSVLATGPNAAEETYEVILRTDAKRVSAIRLEALADPSTVNGGTGRGSNGNFVLSEFEVEVASIEKPGEFEKVALARAEADYSQKNYHVALAIDGKVNKTGWAVDGNSKVENRTAVFVLHQPAGYDSGATLRIRMIHKYGGSHHIARFRLAAHLSDDPPLAPGLALILNKPPAKRSDAETVQLRDWLLQRFGSAEIKTAAGSLKALERQRDQITSSLPSTMVMAEMADPRKAHVLYRGEYDKPREEVQPGTPEALPPMPDDFPRNRLGLARWLVMPDHPLTARVAVNRFWQQLFGNGIVKTTDDFGSQGDWPSHPELLDWLAVELVESEWDVKALLKKMVMSSAYRQTSAITPDLMAADPENRLLARGPRMRLDAEMIRDSALFSAGLLSEQIGGPSAFPYHPQGLWEEINNRPGYSRTYKQDSGEKLFRRSLYTFWKRTVPPPSMAAFDAPGREYCTVRRSRTNTPLQAFVLLHDPQFVEAARHLAGRILTEAGPTNRERIVYGFRLCLSRPPREVELVALGEIVDKRTAQYRADPEAAKQLVSVGDTPVEKSLDEAELAAWTTIGRVLMNLSEFITKS